jgi:ParB family transcriptional regulator, chromosome partitioning protein
VDLDKKLDEYRAMADEISATRLFEVASGGTDERQRKLWELAKAGLTERELRDAKWSDMQVEGAEAEVAEADARTSSPARPRERTVRPLKAGKQLLDMIERLSVTRDHLDGTGAQIDEDHRSRLELLRTRIDQVLGG